MDIRELCHNQKSHTPPTQCESTQLPTSLLDLQNFSMRSPLNGSSRSVLFSHSSLTSPSLSPSLSPSPSSLSLPSLSSLSSPSLSHSPPSLPSLSSTSFPSLPLSSSLPSLPSLSSLVPLSPLSTQEEGEEEAEGEEQTRSSFRALSQRPLFLLSVNLLATYTKINEKKEANTEEYRTDSELALKPGDLIRNYLLLSLLGRGSFGSVIKAENVENKMKVAIKVIKKNPLFYKQGLVEIEFLSYLRDADPTDEYGFVRMYEYFEEGNYLYVVCEPLSVNLYEVLEKTMHRGISMDLVRKFAYQILKSMQFLADHQIIHSDLKPENIMLCHPQKCALKIIDFGSSCRVGENIYKYTQSRFYRAPEVLLELDYDQAIDMWSAACILVELYTGSPLFSGINEEDQLLKIVEVLGMPPVEMISRSPKQHLFFVRLKSSLFSLKSAPGKKINGITLEKHIKRKPQTTESEMMVFINLIEKMLTYNPAQRISPSDCLAHPFFQLSSSSSDSHLLSYRDKHTGSKRHPTSSAPSSPFKLQRRTQ